jgi:chemotaxis protein MotA
LDKSTLPGLLLGFGALIASVLIEGGSLGALLNVPAAVLVFGGTFGTALISFPFDTVISLPKVLMAAILDKPQNPVAIVETFVRLADKARREGLLALEQEAASIEPFAKKGILMVVDGNDPHVVREVLEADVEAMERRHRVGAALLDAMGGFSPTMGIIGTVMGLVNVLSKLEDPAELGHSIAVAFIATLYGVGAANLIWLPIGGKLKQKSAKETWLRELAIEGVLGVQSGDNPRMLREKLEAQLPPAQRAKETAAAGNAGAAQTAAGTA